MTSTSLAPPRCNAPQAFVSSYAPRLRTCLNTLLNAVQPVSVLPNVRTTKRGTTAINYSEDFEDELLDDGDLGRRPTGLRSLRAGDQNVEKTGPRPLAREVYAPIDVQAIWREWMGKPKRNMTDKQVQTQAHLPLNLVPIRIDLTVTPFLPEPALPRPHNAREMGLDENHAAYRHAEMTPEYRVKDYFLWNLHEALMTPDQFAKVFVDELDFPNERKVVLVQQIAQQIRTQLEEHAPIEMHSCFQKTAGDVQPQSATRPRHDGTSTPLGLPLGRARFSLGRESTPTTPQTPFVDTAITTDVHDPNDPDDASRCVITLSVNIQNCLFTDKFEWSLKHPPGLPDIFARQTCADLGLSGEWVPAIAHAIYEAVIKLKRDVVENNGSLAGVVGSGVAGWGEIENEVAEVHADGTLLVGEGAGWRFDNEHLCDEWEPRVEILSKEEIEKREGDRERQLRRMRRETAHRASIMPQNSALEPAMSAGMDDLQRMGRGERSKRKRRFRSTSPASRDAPDVAPSTGQASKLGESERMQWTCSHCRVWGSAVWAVRDGPNGPRSLCHPCGTYFEDHKHLPPWSKDLYAQERAIGSARPEPKIAPPSYTHEYVPPPRASSQAIASESARRAPGVNPDFAPQNEQTNPIHVPLAANGLPEQYAATLRGGGPKMFEDYAEEGEDLDWTKITDPRERKRLQNIINGRKYRERRLAAEASQASARQAGVIDTPGGDGFDGQDMGEQAMMMSNGDVQGGYR